MRVEVGLDEDNFAGEGELYLFASVLNEFFSHYVSLNSFSQLTAKGLKFGEVHEWPPKMGERTLL